jgi:hypothetical protein
MQGLTEKFSDLKTLGRYASDLSLYVLHVAHLVCVFAVVIRSDGAFVLLLLPSSSAAWFAILDR